MIDDASSAAARYQAAAIRPWERLYSPSAEPPNPGARTALDLFRAAPAHALAILYFDAALTYADLDRFSDRHAARFVNAGVRRGDRVAIILQNTPQFLIATIAAWKAGAIAVSLNPMYRTVELRKLFADCEPSVALCQEGQWDNVLPAAEAEGVGLTLWTSGRELQGRDDERVLPPRGGAPGSHALGAVLAAEDQPAFALSSAL